jgi:hypothetical protein
MMKKQILTVIALLISIAGFAQKSEPEIFNGVTKVIIQTEHTQEQAFKAAGSILLEQGYNIEKKDSEFFQISTEPTIVNHQGASYQLSIFVVCSQGKITVTPKVKNLRTWTAEANNAAYDNIAYKKLRPITKLIYNKITKYAEAFNSKSITYSE